MGEERVGSFVLGQDGSLTENESDEAMAERKRIKAEEAAKKQAEEAAKKTEVMSDEGR